MSYQEFVSRKLETIAPSGLEPPFNLPESLFPMQQDLVTWALRRGRAAIFADTGLGKEQPVSEPVLTPEGWRVMGDLRAGDFVVGSDGTPTEVLGVYPQGQKKVFRLELSDGSFVRAGADHLWSVRTKTHKLRGQPFVTLTTTEIANSIHRDWQLPICDPPAMIDQYLSMDPYALGVMLGDGSLSNQAGGASACTDDWIGESLGWHKIADHESHGVGYWRPTNEQKSALAEFGLKGVKSDEKIVPAQYLIASPRQRLALLQGLMDTDGYAMPDGGAEFSSTSRSMFDAVVELVQSLGGVARGERRAAASYVVSGERRIGKPAWRINIKLPSGVCPFRMPRKASVYVNPTKYPPARIVRRVVDEEVTEQQVCIMVAAQDSLYVTRSHILTHNTRMQVTWASIVNEVTGLDGMIIAPLAVAQQTIAEAASIGIHINRCREQSDVKSGLNITNYERIHKFDCSQFGLVVMDESGCIRNHTAKTLQQLLDLFAYCPYKLCATATPAPNDWTELGTHAEFLGVCTRSEMLAEFFVHDGGETQTWRLKGHARHLFWRWVAGWGAMIRKPSDLGYDDSMYDLPPLNIIDHMVDSDEDAMVEDGMMFALEASTMNERRNAKRASLDMRVKECADIVNASTETWVIWCELNAEADALKLAIPDAVEIRGPDDPDLKEQRLLDFASGKIRVLITKSSITGRGLNWQLCANTAYVGISDSFEAFYQTVRRFWRFGQKRTVNVHRFYSQLEAAVMKNLERKQADSIAMGEALAKETSEAIKAAIGGTKKQTNLYDASRKVKSPSWLRSDK